MFHSITFVHLSFLTVFAVLGLRNIFVHRGVRVSMTVMRGDESLFTITQADTTFWFAVLSYMTFDSTTVEFLYWLHAQVTTGDKAVGIIATSLYLPTLGFALFNVCIGTIVVLYNTAKDLWMKARSTRQK